MTKIIAITNPKGGVAKSTSTTALACIAGEKNNVLLIDLDPQGTCTYLTKQFGRHENTASDMFKNDPLLPSDLAIKTEFGFDLVPASPNLINAVDWIASTTLGEQRLKMLFAQDKELQKYDYIFIDTAGDKGRLLTSVMLATDSILVPVKPSAVVLNDLVDYVGMISDISSIRESMGQKALNVDSIFFSMVDGRTLAARDNIEQLMAGLDQYRVAATMIPSSTAIEKAATKMSPVPAAYPNEKVSQCYQDLFNEIYGAVA